MLELGRRVDLDDLLAGLFNAETAEAAEKNPNDFSACSASSAFKRRFGKPDTTYSAEEVANIFRQQFRFFGRGEVSPLAMFVQRCTL